MPYSGMSIAYLVPEILYSSGVLLNEVMRTMNVSDAVVLYLLQ